LNRRAIADIDRPPAVIIGVTWANGLGLIRSLGEAGVPVVALDSHPDAIGLSSRYVVAALVCPDPGGAEPAFIEFMGQLGRRLGSPGVLFLTRDQDLSTVSRNQALLERYFRFPFVGWEVLKQIVDKRGQYAVAQDAGVPLPTTLFPENETEVRSVAWSLPYPVIIKPAYHASFSERFGVKGFLANNSDETLTLYRRGVEHGYDMMIQEVIPGGPERLYTYGSTLDPEGKPLAQFTGRKLRQNPSRFGTCRLGECVYAPQVAELGLRLLRALGFWGTSQVEFKLDPRDNVLKLIEVNARNYQWQHLSTVCGANLAHAAYLHALGEPVRPVEANAYGRRWILAASDVALSLREWARGQIRLVDWLAGWRGVAVDGIFSVRDPAPGLHYLWNQTRRRSGYRP
jgi:predicted ATP-grasp superfamily ATP-dependent carboligase